MKKYMLYAAALLSLAACSSDEDMAGDSNALVEIRLTSSLEGQTRATHDLDTQFASGEEVHVWVDDAGTDGALYTDNTLTADGSGALSGGTTMYFPSSGNAVDIYAIHGNLDYTDFWGETVTHSVAQDQQSTGTGYATSDLAYCAMNDVKRTNESIGLTFRHLLSKVEVVLKQGNGAPSIETVEIINTQLDATFTPDKGSEIAVTAAGDAGAIVIDNDVTETYEMLNEAIIVPQTLTEGTQFIRITTRESGVLYYKLPAEITFEPGKKYHYTIIVNLTGLIVTSSITDWGVGVENADGSAEMEIDYTISTDDNGTRTYTVYNEAGLLSWSEYTRSGNWNTNCTLANDISLTEKWTAVGEWIEENDASNQYTGTFDGNGHAIANLTINASSDDQGLIGVLGSEGVVKNLTLTDVNIANASKYIGAVAGTNEGTITNCSVTGTISGTNYIGGVVGENYGGTITACNSAATVNGTDYTGGVVGSIYNNGAVTACYSAATVAGTTCTGGVVGYTDSGTVTACYSTGTVSGYYYTGGVVGFNFGTVTACYSTGVVNGTGLYSGGVVGLNSEGTVNACYYESSASDENATKVEDSSAWAEAASAMNETLTGSGWQYDGDGTDTPPLTLVAE